MICQFADAIAEEPDFFLLVGYVRTLLRLINSHPSWHRQAHSTRKNQQLCVSCDVRLAPTCLTLQTGPAVFNAVRAVHPTTPIVILGGTFVLHCFSIASDHEQGIRTFVTAVSTLVLRVSV